jgi:Iodothyronine deiodinase
VAKTCSAKLDIKFPILLDDMDNKTNTDYSGWPDRLYIVGKDGKIAYKGGPGPRGFNVKEMSGELEKLLK